MLGLVAERLLLRLVTERLLLTELLLVEGLLLTELLLRDLRGLERGCRCTIGLLLRHLGWPTLLRLLKPLLRPLLIEPLLLLHFVDGVPAFVLR